jgi:hypothetical protein
VRLLGVSASGLGDAGDQLGMFAAETRPSDRLRDTVRARFGDGALVRASVLEGAKGDDPAERRGTRRLLR